MKRHLFIFFLVLLPASALAQSGLAVAHLFNNKLLTATARSSISLKGEKVKPYNLTLFRSITCIVSDDIASNVEKVVLTDAARAIEHETGMKDGKLYYGFYRLPAEKDQNRYIFYRNNSLRKGGDETFVLIYMEGKATIAELKRHFGK